MNTCEVPVIVEESLLNGELHEQLKSQQFKIRASSKTPFRSCVFPMSSVICVVECFSNIVSTEMHLKQNFLEGLNKVTTLHYKQYIFLLAPLIGSDELNVLTILQERYFKTSLQFIPVHNIEECLSGILDIIKVNCKPTSGFVKERYSVAMERLISSEETVMSILKKTDLTEHEASVAIDGCGSLKAIASSDVNHITNHTSLDKHCSSLLTTFLSKNVFN